VVHKSSGNKLGYGELAAEASTMPIPASDKLRLKEPSKFRYIGKGGIDIVDRKAIANFKRLALDLKDSSRAKSPGGSKTEHRGGRQDLGANCLRPGI
jgi:hypothetical protein